MSKKRMGVFGGTFDPPHVGHLILAMEAHDQLGLEKVLWVIAPDPPHKVGKKIAALKTRIKLVEAAINQDPAFELSFIDINRPGPHYVLDTMRIVNKEYPNNEHVFLMGGDSLQNLVKWYKPQEFVAACDRIGVMRRPGEVIDVKTIGDALPELEQKLEFIDAPLLEISSNQIRHLIRSGKPFRYYLPESVYNIIKQMDLYNEEEAKDE